MKTSIALFLVFFCSIGLQAKPAGTPYAARKLGTKFDFEDMMVKGKYQYPDEGITAVEDEKALNDLLGVRRHFKDKLENASARH